MDGHIWQDTRETIGDVIRRWAEIQPDAAAFVSENQAPLTYRALARTIDDVRDTLNKSGFGRGDRIAIVHPGGADMATILLGVMDACVAVPVDPASLSENILDRCHKLGISGLIMGSSSDAKVHDALSELGLPVFLAESDRAMAGNVSLRQITGGKLVKTPRDQPDDLAVILASSGTTAEAKIVPIRHRHILVRSAATAQLLDLTPEDCGLNMNKLFLHGGLANMCVCLHSGGSVIMVPRFDPNEFFKHLSELRPTWYVGSFTVNKAVFEAARKQQKPINVGRLRMVRTTSGGIDAHIADRLEELLGVPVIEAYATTETGRIAGNPQPPGLRKRGTVGLPINCEIAIMDEVGNSLGSNHAGEVVVRGDNVFDGYENNPVANSTAFFGGWYRTGDEGSLDDDGYLTLTGRFKEMINRGGEKISSQEVESAQIGRGHV